MKYARNRGAIVVALALAGTVGFAACGDDATPIGPADVSGSWVGATSQNQPLTFTVTPAGVSAGSFGYQMQGVCTFTATALINTTDALPIDAAHFTTGKTQIGDNAFFTASGDFSSTTAATGTFTIAHGPCADTLNLTWHATKQ